MAEVVSPSSSAALLKLPKRAAVVNACRFSSVKIEFICPLLLSSTGHPLDPHAECICLLDDWATIFE
jgi:hypothetical protein